MDSEQSCEIDVFVIICERKADQMILLFMISSVMCCFCSITAAKDDFVIPLSLYMR